MIKIKDNNIFSRDWSDYNNIILYYRKITDVISIKFSLTIKSTDDYENNLYTLDGQKNNSGLVYFMEFAHDNDAKWEKW